jgi:pilus assembly protein Flp/PilA
MAFLRWLAGSLAEDRADPSIITELKMNMFQLLQLHIKNAMAKEDGVTAVEYGMIAALIAAVIIGAVTTIGTKLSTMFTTIGTDI